MSGRFPPKGGFRIAIRHACESRREPRAHRDRPLAVGIGGGIGQRFIGRQIDDAGADRGNFHRMTLSGVSEAQLLPIL